LVIGAGGHFCPVARLRGANARHEVSVAAQEMEFEMSETQREQCSIRPEIPELYFCADMKGYGWCVRKKDFLNIGLGRLDPHALPSHLAAFGAFLKKRERLLLICLRRWRAIRICCTDVPNETWPEMVYC
jgi:hypothetical protein